MSQFYLELESSDDNQHEILFRTDVRNGEKFLSVVTKVNGEFQDDLNAELQMSVDEAKSLVGYLQGWISTCR